jgi:threonine dehydrogenase-like Zn-dependent dehydrogenase
VRAVIVSPDRTLEVVDRPEPSPGPGEVVIAVQRCGICGSDLHLHGSGLIPPGAVMGHEFAGTVVETGQRVAVLPSGRTDDCARCREGRSHLCQSLGSTSLGLGLHDGAYAEYVKVAATSCHPIPDDMTFDQAALVEPYAVALHAVRRCRPALTAGVIGAGPIGLLVVAALRQAGVERIVVAERSETRQAAAHTMGATVTDDATRLARTAGGELDVVFDAAGVAVTTPVALEAVRPGGQIVLVGVVDIGVVLEMPGMLWVVKEVDVVPSIAYTDDEFAEAIEHIHAGAVDASLLVSDVRPLEAAQQSFTDLRTASGPLKVQLSPSGS